jgi:hypothetical protein
MPSAITVVQAGRKARCHESEQQTASQSAGLRGREQHTRPDQLEAKLRHGKCYEKSIERDLQGRERHRDNRELAHLRIRDENAQRLAQID